MRRRDNPHVYWYRPRGPQGSHLFFLEHAQQFDLQGERHITDLIQEQDTLMRALKQTGVVVRRPRKRTPGITKQL